MDCLSLWHIWLIIAILFLLTELFHASSLMLSFAIGAFAAMIAAACESDFILQIPIFAIVTFLCCVRPLTLKRINKKLSQEQQMQIDKMAGREAKVIDIIDETGGRIAIDGIDWKAIDDKGATHQIGETVTIKYRKGNTLYI